MLNILKTVETRYVLRYNDYIFMYFMHQSNFNKYIIQWTYFYQALPGRGQKYPKSLQPNKIYKQMKTNHLNLNAGKEGRGHLVQNRCSLYIFNQENIICFKQDICGLFPVPS